MIDEPFAAWMPSCGTHNGAYNDQSFYGTTISFRSTNYSMRESLERFLTKPPADVHLARSDGITAPGGNAMTTTSCG